MRAARILGSLTAISVVVVSSLIAVACTGDDPVLSSTEETPDAFAPSNEGGGNDGATTGDSALPPEPPPAPQNKTSWAYFVENEGDEHVPVAVADDGYSFVAAKYTAAVAGLPSSANSTPIMLALLDVNGKEVWKKGIVPTVTGATFEPAAVAFDAAGDMYLAGTSNSAADFGGGVKLQSSAAITQSYGFLVKLRRSDGQGLWVKTFISPTQAAVVSMSVRGNAIALAGTFYQSLDLDKVGGGKITLTGGQPIFVASLDRATGLASWGKTASAVVASGPPLGNASGVALDDAGNVYVGGSFRGTLSGLGADLVMIGNEGNGFVASLGAAGGAPRWSRSFGSATATSGLRVLGVAASKGIVAIGGQVPAATDFGDGKPVGTSGTTDAFIAGFEPATGAPKWSTVLGGDDGAQDGEAINAIAVDRFDQVVGVGDYRKTFSVDGTTLVTPPTIPGAGPARCFFGVKVDAAGKPLWAKSIASTVLFSGQSAAAQKSGSFVVSGHLKGSNVDLGSGPPVSTGTSNTNLAVLGWTP